MCVCVWQTQCLAKCIIIKVFLFCQQVKAQGTIYKAYKADLPRFEQDLKKFPTRSCNTQYIAVLFSN